jgi:DNA-binding IclR family transcriptional regulator
MRSKSLPEKPAHTVPVLRKAIRVLEAVAEGNGVVTTKSLAATLRISPTTCYRILQSFVAEGWLRSAAHGTFELSFRLVPLLRPLLRHELLIETVREPLSALARTTGLTAKLTVRQGDDAVTIYSANSPKGTAITSRVGSVVSLAIGSSGATFLAQTDDEEVARVLTHAPADVWRFQKREDVLRRVRECRRAGCCYDNGSYQPQIHTLSAPLLAPERELAGVITLLGFPQDFDPALRPSLIRELKFTSGGCTQLIAGHTAHAA